MKLRYMWIFTISIHLKGIIQKNKIKQKAKRPKLSFLFPLFEFPTVSKEPNKIQIYPFELHKIQRETTTQWDVAQTHASLIIHNQTSNLSNTLWATLWNFKILVLKKIKKPKSETHSQKTRNYPIKITNQ